MASDRAKNNSTEGVPFENLAEAHAYFDRWDQWGRHAFSRYYASSILFVGSGLEQSGMFWTVCRANAILRGCSKDYREAHLRPWIVLCWIPDALIFIPGFPLA